MVRGCTRNGASDHPIEEDSMKTMQSSLQQDVESELQWEPALDSARIGVSVDQGVVVLTGHVRNWMERQAAEEAVKRVRGVTTVANELEVDLLPGHVRDDVDIGRAARDALRWNVLVPESQIKVMVAKGWVTLEGKVAHDYQRRTAVATVQHLTGVVGVTDLIKIETPVSPFDLRRKLAAALHRYAQLEADGIQLQVDGSKVTLTGKARSWRERDLIQEAAWSAPGVTAVDNRLEVRSF
jgi:osmotically-inducible protein OsmY